jgi:hypothetical protein
MMRDRLSPVPSIGADPRAAISFKRNRRAIIAEGTNFSGAVYFQSHPFGNKTNRQVEDHRPARGVGLPRAQILFAWIANGEWHKNYESQGGDRLNDLNTSPRAPVRLQGFTCSAGLD